MAFELAKEARKLSQRKEQMSLFDAGSLSKYKIIKQKNNKRLKCEINSERKMTKTITRLRTKHYKGMTIHPDDTITYRACNNCPDLPPKHSWYSGVNPGGALNLRNRQHQTTLTRFRTGHLKPLKIENNNKIYLPCPKCSLAPAAPEHILACIRCTKQDLWERPLLIIKQLEEHELMEFVGLTPIISRDLSTISVLHQSTNGNGGDYLLRDIVVSSKEIGRQRNGHVTPPLVDHVVFLDDRDLEQELLQAHIESLQFFVGENQHGFHQRFQVRKEYLTSHQFHKPYRIHMCGKKIYFGQYANVEEYVNMQIDGENACLMITPGINLGTIQSYTLPWICWNFGQDGIQICSGPHHRVKTLVWSEIVKEQEHKLLA
ncbi:hypothetical protein LAZ67_23002379 [Cordylochernes scorpioides]|uniref:Uncharacterized protein n=1 Tax=Cordylochernes scorpioides TaxID=51811 RepID=A0ABY6LVI9_9ARAC|nr:hypothetical protein LAZ67_23002379 [Cordylochernes scorpioides]